MMSEKELYDVIGRRKTMTHERFEEFVNGIYLLFYSVGEIVVFGEHKYGYEKEYEPFEIIISEVDGKMEINWDYHEGQDEYVINGWDYLSNVIYIVHRHKLYGNVWR